MSIDVSEEHAAYIYRSEDKSRHEMNVKHLEHKSSTVIKHLREYGIQFSMTGFVHIRRDITLSNYKVVSTALCCMRPWPTLRGTSLTRPTYSPCRERYARLCVWTHQFIVICCLFPLVGRPGPDKHHHAVRTRVLTWLLETSMKQPTEHFYKTPTHIQHWRAQLVLETSCWRTQDIQRSSETSC
jgi:hypothetical protein